jgi:acetyl esterase/lipase
MFKLSTQLNAASGAIFLAAIGCSLLLTTAAEAGCAKASPLAPTYCTYQQPFPNWSFTDEEAWLPNSVATHRIVYDPSTETSFGDLRLPWGFPPRDGWPVVVYIHGGAWTVDVSLDYVARFVEKLSYEGVAVWDLEFRRIGNVGGGWPNTFLDVAKGTDYLRNIAETYHLNLGRVVAMGHSSGGHLALWLAARHKLPPNSDLYIANPLPIMGVVAQAGIPDLAGALAGGRTDVYTILGTTDPTTLAQRYAEASPLKLLPLGVPQKLFVGTLDNSWRVSTNISYTAAAKAAHDSADLTIFVGANHFDNTDPDGPAWPDESGAALSLLKLRQPWGR